MGVVIDEIIADVQPEPSRGEDRAPAAPARGPRLDVAQDVRRAASRAARVHAD